MPRIWVAIAFGVVAAAPAAAQVGSIPPNAIDRAIKADDTRRSATSAAAAADRDRAARDARASATDIGPVPQSTMTDRVTPSSTGPSSIPTTTPPPATPD